MWGIEWVGCNDREVVNDRQTKLLIKCFCFSLVVGGGFTIKIVACHKMLIKPFLNLYSFFSM